MSLESLRADFMLPTFIEKEDGARGEGGREERRELIVEPQGNPENG